MTDNNTAHIAKAQKDWVCVNPTCGRTIEARSFYVHTPGAVSMFKGSHLCIPCGVRYGYLSRNDLTKVL